MNEPAFSALDPPTTRPRGTGTVSPEVSSPVSSQLAGCPGTAARMVAASRISAGKCTGTAWSAPASSSSTRRPASDNRAASAQPAVPAPTTTTSQASVTVEPEDPGQIEAAHLSGGGARQVVEPVHGLGPLGRRPALPRPDGQVGRLRRTDVGGDHPLPPLLVGHPEDGALHDVGVRVEHRLDLGRVDVDPSGDDQVLAPAVEPDEPVVVHPAQVADGHPVAPPGRRGLLRCAPVLEPRPAGHRAPQLAPLVGLQPATGAGAS